MLTSLTQLRHRAAVGTMPGCRDCGRGLALVRVYECVQTRFRSPVCRRRVHFTLSNEFSSFRWKTNSSRFIANFLLVLSLVSPVSATLPVKRAVYPLYYKRLPILLHARAMMVHCCRVKFGDANRGVVRHSSSWLLDYLTSIRVWNRIYFPADNLPWLVNWARI